MGIKHFWKFLNSKQASHPVPLKQLQGATFIVDASVFSYKYIIQTVFLSKKVQSPLELKD